MIRKTFEPGECGSFWDESVGWDCEIDVDSEEEKTELQKDETEKKNELSESAFQVGAKVCSVIVAP